MRSSRRIKNNEEEAGARGGRGDVKDCDGSGGQKQGPWGLCRGDSEEEMVRRRWQGSRRRRRWRRIESIVIFCESIYSEIIVANLT